MPDVQKVKIVPYSPEQMFTLVNDIRNYPKFVPWCSKTEIHKESDDEMQATLHFEGGGFTKSFTTHNLLKKNKMIEIRLINGPFSHLEGFWRFEQNGDSGCTVKLDLEFEMSGGLLSLAFAPMFHQVANKLVDSFCTRADELYGRA